MGTIETKFSSIYEAINGSEATLDTFVKLFGEVEKKSKTGEVKNYFLVPYNDKIKTVCISCLEKTPNIVHSIIIYTKKPLFPFKELMEYAINFKKDFVIYDEKVEFTFVSKATSGSIKSFSAKHGEDSLSFNEAQINNIVFDNIAFEL